MQQDWIEKVVEVGWMDWDVNNGGAPRRARARARLGDFSWLDGATRIRFSFPTLTHKHTGKVKLRAS